MKHPKENMIVPHDWRFFTQEEDQNLTDLHHEFGNRWKKISEKTDPTRDPTIIKHRIAWLDQLHSNATRMHRYNIPSIEELDAGAPAGTYAGFASGRGIQIDDFLAELARAWSAPRW